MTTKSNSNKALKGLSSLGTALRGTPRLNVVPHSPKRAAEAKRAKIEKLSRNKITPTTTTTTKAATTTKAKSEEKRVQASVKQGERLLNAGPRSTQPLLPTKVRQYSSEGKPKVVQDAEDEELLRESREGSSEFMAQPKLNANSGKVIQLTKFNHQTHCGDCLHFNGSRHPELNAPCSKMGISSKAVSPQCYTPDVTAMRSMGPNVFQTLALLVASMTPRQTRVFMGMLKYAGSLERLGYQFLQEVYFTVSDEYLESYYKGYVIGVGKAHELIIVGTDYLQASKATTIAYLSKESVMSADKFARYAKKCVEQGKFYKPQTKKAVLSDNHIVPTLDNSPIGERGDKKARKNKGGAGSGRTVDTSKFVIESAG